MLMFKSELNLYQNKNSTCCTMSYHELQPDAKKLDLLYCTLAENVGLHTSAKDVELVCVC